MSQSSVELQKVLIEVKVRLLQGLQEEGLRLLESVKDKIDLNQHNWLLCNIIDIGDCEIIIKFLERFGNLFDLTRCKNLKRVIFCAIVNESSNINPYFETALKEVIKRKDETVFDSLIPALMESEKINSQNIALLINSCKTLGLREKCNQFIEIACRKGLKEICNKILTLSYT